MTPEELNNLERAERILENSGFRDVGFIEQDGIITHITMEDPGCIFRSFEGFLEFAWTVLAFITGILLAGWAWAMIRGSKNAELKSIANNIKNLVLIFCALTVTPFIVNAIYGRQLFKRIDGELVFPKCKHFKIPYDKVQDLLAKRDDALGSFGEDGLYEYLDVYDSALETPPEQVSLSQEPLDLDENMEEIYTSLYQDNLITLNELNAFGWGIDENGNAYRLED